MIGALSIHHGLVLTQVFLGSNTVDSFLPFIQKLKRINPLQKRIVVMDNLSVHHSKIVKEEFDNRWFMYQFLPPQSCELNPIERVWNLIKGQWRKNSYRILDIAKKKEDQLTATINAINGISANMDKDLMRKIARCNYEAMTKTL
jgi:transposase